MRMMVEFIIHAEEFPIDKVSEKIGIQPTEIRTKRR